MKKINKNVFTVIAALTTIIATSVASSACVFFMYQPEEPKSLKEKM